MWIQNSFGASKTEPLISLYFYVAANRFVEQYKRATAINVLIELLPRFEVAAIVTPCYGQSFRIKAR